MRLAFLFTCRGDSTGTDGGIFQVAKLIVRVMKVKATLMPHALGKKKPSRVLCALLTLGWSKHCSTGTVGAAKYLQQT